MRVPHGLWTLNSPKIIRTPSNSEQKCYRETHLLYYMQTWKRTHQTKFLLGGDKSWHHSLRRTCQGNVLWRPRPSTMSPMFWKRVFGAESNQHLPPILRGILGGLFMAVSPTLNSHKVRSPITKHLSSFNLDSWQIKVRATSEGLVEHAEHWTHFFKKYINFIDIVSKG